MSQDPERLDADVLKMLHSALPMTDVPVEARARILSRVEARIVTLPPTQGGGRGSGSGDPGAAPLAGPARWIASHPWLAVSAAFMVGAGMGVGLRGEAPPARVVYVDRSPSATPTATTPTAAAAASSVPVETLPVASSRKVENEDTAPRGFRGVPQRTEGGTGGLGTGERLAAESALLDIARTALAAGDADHALEAVDKHAASFPHGLLAEEREALGIRALLMAGRVDEGRSRLARFRTRYPESLVLPAVESASRQAE